MFGFLKDVGKDTVSEAADKLDPLIHGVVNRFGGMMHGLLDRLDGTEITVKIKIPPLPKAEAVE